MAVFADASRCLPPNRGRSLMSYVSRRSSITRDTLSMFHCCCCVTPTTSVAKTNITSRLDQLLRRFSVEKTLRVGAIKRRTLYSKLDCNTVIGCRKNQSERRRSVDAKHSSVELDLRRAVVGRLGRYRSPLRHFQRGNSIPIRRRPRHVVN